jgi:APA family basic amino acid/polyamine antiporter
VAELRRSLGPTHATAMVVGSIIGASIFVQPSEITRAMPTVDGIILVWIVAGALTLLGALVCAELASAFPRAGGVYTYLTEAYSPAIGFLWGWAMFWTMHSGIIAAIATVCARYVAVFLPMDDAGLRLTAVAVILLLSAVNYAGVRYGGAVQNAFTAAKLLAIAALILAGLLWAAPAASPASGMALGTASEAAAGATLGGFFLAVSAGLFAYGGWHMVTYTAGETREAARTLPRALIAGTIVVTACYAGLNAIYLRVLSLDAVRASSHVAADAADVLFGTGAGGGLGATLMAALVVVSTFGAVNGIIMVGPRAYYQMAHDGAIFRWLGAVHPRFGTPARAIALQAVWASALAATNTYGALFSRVIYTEWLFFAAMAAGLILLRRRGGYAPAYRVRGVPAVPVIFIVVSIAVVVVQVAAAPLASATGLGMVLAGWPVYAVWRRAATRR